MRFYERFYQIDEAVGSDRFFRHIGNVVRKYKDLYRIIAIWAINYFTAHNILNAYMGVAFNGYKHYTTNNFEKLLKEKNGSKNISVIITPILVKIEMHIGSTEFLDNGVSNVIFGPDKRIQKGVILLLLKKFMQ